MKWARAALTVALVSAALFFFVGEVWSHRDAVVHTRWTGVLVAGVVTAVFVQVCSAVLDAWAWTYFLSALGQALSARQAVSIFAVSQFAKYLPGNVAQHVGRVSLAREAGWGTATVVASLVAENATALCAGALLAILVGPTVVDLPHSQLSFAAYALVALGSVGALMAIRHVLAHPPSVISKRFPEMKPVRLGTTTLAVYCAVHVVSYIAMGIAVLLLLRGTSGGWPLNAWALPGVLAVSWLAGYLVPGAPAGLGVREALLTALLARSVAVSAVVSAVLLFRLTSLAADGLVLGIGIALRRPSAPSGV